MITALTRKLEADTVQLTMLLDATSTNVIAVSSTASNVKVKRKDDNHITVFRV